MIFVRENVKILSTSYTETNDIEILTIELTNCTVTSIYKPLNIPFKFIKTTNFENQGTKIVSSDFNNHNSSWGYNETNGDEEEVEKWAEVKDLILVHNTKLASSFNSGRWRRGVQPEHNFCEQQC